MTFKTHYSERALTYEERVCRYSKPRMKSITVPDQTLTIEQLLARYVTGQDLPQAEPVYLEPGHFLYDIPIETMDADERQEILHALADYQKETVTSLRKKKQKHREEERQPVPENPPKIEDDLAGV